MLVMGGLPFSIHEFKGELEFKDTFPMSGFARKDEALFAPRSSISKSMEIFMPSCERELGVDGIR
jgi:hypothetical protein